MKTLQDGSGLKEHFHSGPLTVQDPEADSEFTAQTLPPSALASAPPPDDLNEGDASSEPAAAPEIDASSFRRRLMSWYRRHARILPWRQTTDPYRIWVSEVMLQQTRVAAVIEHYTEFLRRFPTLVSLALASEPDVLAAWSGLGYYRRARMLHKAARFIVLERSGMLPATAAELRTLPGIGDYTAAAIASIAFGESIAVVDGNVERVILRLTGRAEQSSAQARSFIRSQAQGLIPARRLIEASPSPAPMEERPANSSVWTAAERLAIAAAAHPQQPARPTPAPPAEEPRSAPESEVTGEVLPGPAPRVNAAGDHNQAVMELGATICLPRAPLCLQCPVFALCRTRGEHATPPRARQLSRPVAYLLQTRKRGTSTEVLVERRPADASLMPGMFELPPLPVEAVENREPILRLRHSITSTNYYVQVYAGSSQGPLAARRADAALLRAAIPVRHSELDWIRTSHLGILPLTGLARKILHRLKIMEGPAIELLK